jgi:hypothetical protein
MWWLWTRNQNSLMQQLTRGMYSIVPLIKFTTFTLIHNNICLLFHWFN